MSSVGSFSSDFNDARSHEPEVWIVVPSLLGFGSLRFLLEEQIYLVAETTYHSKIPENSGPELLEEY